MLYKKKQSLLNSHILHLTFSLIGTIDSNKEITIIPNRVAFEDLLCDLEVKYSFILLWVSGTSHHEQTGRISLDLMSMAYGRDNYINHLVSPIYSDW